jgi:glucuronate isomerase
MFRASCGTAAPGGFWTRSMERQMNALSNMGLPSRIVGMLTDSRSFLAHSRHDHFRRLSCNMLGDDVRRGHLPHDLPLLGDLVRKACGENAREYLRFPESSGSL